jgi:hypothetical protein
VGADPHPSGMKTMTTAPRRAGPRRAARRTLRTAPAKKTSFAAVAEKFRGMLKDGPADLSVVKVSDVRHLADAGPLIA